MKVHGEVLRFVVPRSVGLAVLLPSLLALGGCSPRLLLVKSVADELAGQGQADEEDMLLARDAGAFYLKLSESVLRQTPGHLALAEAVAGGFTQYAYAFVAFEGDRIETQDARAARRLHERAARLYRRAQRHAMAALEQHQPGLGRALAGVQPLPGGAPLRLPVEQVGVAYWAAASWGAWIALSKDQPEIVADLPAAVRLARLAYDTQPSHGDGALASLLGSFEAARPGGSRADAEALFDRAFAAGHQRNAGAYVAKAEALALPAGDRPAFEALLRQALVIAAARRDLNNEVMRQRAQWLLDSADDRF